MKRILGVLVLLGVTQLFLTACGGSSSETPPPLEPSSAPIAVDESEKAPAPEPSATAPASNY